MGALLADRTEQETGEPTVPARSDDQKILAGDRADERFDGPALDNLSLDLEAVRFHAHIGDLLVEQRFGRLM